MRRTLPLRKLTIKVMENSSSNFMIGNHYKVSKNVYSYLLSVDVKMPT